MTVLAFADADLMVRSVNVESVEVRWWPMQDVTALKLHSGFADGLADVARADHCGLTNPGLWLSGRRLARSRRGPRHRRPDRRRPAPQHHRNAGR